MGSEPGNTPFCPHCGRPKSTPECHGCGAGVRTDEICNLGSNAGSMPTGRTELKQPCHYCGVRQSIIAELQDKLAEMQAALREIIVYSEFDDDPEISTMRDMAKAGLAASASLPAAPKEKK